MIDTVGTTDFRKIDASDFGKTSPERTTRVSFGVLFLELHEAFTCFEPDATLTLTRLLSTYELRIAWNDSPTEIEIVHILNHSRTRVELQRSVDNQVRRRYVDKR